MKVTIKTLTRGVKIFVDGKHKKTLPKKIFHHLKPAEVLALSFEKKRLTPAERKEVHSIIQFRVWTQKIESSEKYLYNLIKDAKPVTRRVVTTTTGNRFEIILDNKIKLKVPEKTYLAIDLPIAATTYSNY